MFSILQEQKRLSDRKREMMIVLAGVFLLLINCGKAKEKGVKWRLFSLIPGASCRVCDRRKQIADDRSNNHANNEGTEQVF